MNKYQFAAIFFSIALLREQPYQILENAIMVCATLSFLIAFFQKERSLNHDSN